ncbi:TPA: transposase [Klebsiella oxytoca]|uniref:Transposase n=1 Tax=Klebsiella oxytoca TaxID=571 RepID=A0AAN5RFP9_KLEOX|nr:transposase [Klebsiella oxytoca]
MPDFYVTFFTELNLPCFLEPRLLRRYEMMTEVHIRPVSPSAPGVKALDGHHQAWGASQAAWRFFNNENASFPLLSGPLLALAREAASAFDSQNLLVAHDWSHCNFPGHSSKTDRAKLSHEHDIGYELQASLLIDSTTGYPLAPLGLNLRTAHGTYQWQEADLQPVQPHLDELVDRIHWQNHPGLDKPLVHVVDREADSVPHLKQLTDCLWLTRSRKGTTLLHDGKYKTVAEIASKLPTELVGPVPFREGTAYLFAGETPVLLRRKTERNTADAPAVRLVLSLVVDENGKVLACWYLLSNVMDVSATELSRWYCLRWNIESWFKLLKSDGFCLEDWQQSSGEALFRRLLVNSMACTLTFRLYRDESGDALHLKRFLIGLSGRVTKRSKPITLPALLAGLYVFLQMQEMMNSYTMDELKDFARIAGRFFGQLV